MLGDPLHTLGVDFSQLLQDKERMRRFLSLGCTLFAAYLRQCGQSSDSLSNLQICLCQVIPQHFGNGRITLSELKHRSRLINRIMLKDEWTNK